MKFSTGCSCVTSTMRNKKPPTNSGILWVLNFTSWRQNNIEIIKMSLLGIALEKLGFPIVDSGLFTYLQKDFQSSPTFFLRFQTVLFGQKLISLNSIFWANYAGL